MEIEQPDTNSSPIAVEIEQSDTGECGVSARVKLALEIEHFENKIYY